MSSRARRVPGRASAKRTRPAARDATAVARRAPHARAATHYALLAVLLVLTAAIGAPRTAAAQEAGRAAPAAVRGVVVTTDAVPISGASVTLAPAVGSARTLVTAEDGRFAFEAAPGAAELRVRRIGFRAESLAVTLPAAPGDSVVVRLAFVPRTLDAVVVQGRATDRRPPAIVDFYRRRERGGGRFVTRAEIERRQPQRTTDILRTVPGIRVQTSGAGSSLRYRESRCAPDVYLDGLPLGAGEFDVDAVPPSTIEGIEVHSLGTVPAEYTRPFGRASCGTVLLWSRYGEAPPPRRAKKPVTSDSLARLVAQLQLYSADQVDTPAQPPADFGGRVALPDSVRVQGVLAVIAEFVVDAVGRVEPATINVVASPHPALADAVRAALPGAVFAPARRAGLAVRQLVQLSVRFDSP